MRKDYFRFDKLSRKYNNQTEYENFVVANLLERDVSWVGGLMDDEATHHYLEWQKRTQALGYRFGEECEQLMTSPVGFDALFKPQSPGELPPLLNKLLWHEVSIETFLIIERMLGFFAKFDRLEDPMGQWARTKMKCNKYWPFLNRLGIDLDKFRQTAKQKVEMVRYLNA